MPEQADEIEPESFPDRRRELQRNSQDFYDDLFALSMRCQKTLVFTNRRKKAERIAAEMRQRLKQAQPGRDWYFVHHGSIAANLREAAEMKMRDKTQQSCIIATSSLELGIDIGHLDLIMQIDAPHTVSSFVQRLGRSGRRGNPSRMCFYTFEYLPRDAQPTPELMQIPWNFLQTIAIIQLYLEERWIEPPTIPTMPLSLLYQQTMSVMQARTELTPAQLAHSILKLSPFKSISLDEYRLFLQHLVTLDHLAKMDEGTLIVGMKGARITNFYQFYAIFATEQEWQVLAGTQEVGTIQQAPEVESVIGLAGYAWRVISVDEHSKTAHVERARGAVKPNWTNTGELRYHERIMLRLRQVLQEETIYPYLSSPARQRLVLTRNLVRRTNWLAGHVIPLNTWRFVLFPWTGSRIYLTLAHILEQKGWYTEKSNPGYYLGIVHPGSAAEVLAELRAFSSQVPELVKAAVNKLDDRQLWRGKYDYLAPRPLLEKAYMHDVLDIPGTIRWLETCS